MRFERTDDAALVTSILSSPAIWDAITDDSCAAREDFQVKLHPALWPITVHDGDELLGIFLFEVRNAVEWTVHTCLLPNAWGPRGKAASREMMQWIWDNTPCRRITTAVPEYNRLALRFAKQAGLSEYGKNEKSWLKNGALFTQIELGISKD